MTQKHKRLIKQATILSNNYHGFPALHTDLAFLGAVLQTFTKGINYRACPKRDIFEMGGICNHMLILSDGN